MPTVFTIDPRNAGDGKVFISSVFEEWKLFFGSLWFSCGCNFPCLWIEWLDTYLLQSDSCQSLGKRSKKLLLAKDASRYVCYTNMQLNLTFKTHPIMPAFLSGNWKMHIPLYSQKLSSDELADSDANFSVGLACHAPRDSENEISEPVVKIHLVNQILAPLYWYFISRANVQRYIPIMKMQSYRDKRIKFSLTM